MIYIFFKERCL